MVAAGVRSATRFEARLDSRLPAATFALSNSLAGFLVAWLTDARGVAVEIRHRTVVVASFASQALFVGCFG